MNAVIAAACANPPAGGGTIYFPAGGIVSSSTIASASYNSGTGVVTITTSSAVNIPNGNLVVVRGLIGTGSYDQLNGTFVNTGSGGTSVSYASGKTGLTATITGGTVVQPGVYRTDAQIAIPTDNATANENSNTPYPHACNLRFTGAGGGLNWRGYPNGASGDASGGAMNATLIDLRFQSAVTGLDSPEFSLIPATTTAGYYINNPLIAGTITGSLSGTTLTCTSNCTSLAIGQTLFGVTTALTEGTKITGGSGTSWTVNKSQTVASQNIYALSAGSGYAVGNYVVLSPVGGTQTAAATAKINAVDSNGAILHFEWGVQSGTGVAAGSFTVNPTSFTQASTTGSGTGVVFNNPKYFGRQPKIAANGAGALVIDHLGLIDLGTSNTTPFIATSLAVLTVENNTFYGTNNPYQTAIIMGGDTDSYLDPLNRNFQGYGSQIRFNHFKNVGRAAWYKATANNPIFSYNSIFNSGQSAIEINSDYTAIARSNGDQNLSAVVENNILEAQGSIGVFAKIVASSFGTYSNNSTYDGSTYTYFTIDGGDYNNIFGPYLGATLYTLVGGDAADTQTQNIITQYSSSGKGTTGYGSGPEFFGQMILKNSYNPGNIGTKYPGGFIVPYDSSGREYGSIGYGTGASTGFSRSLEIDSYSLNAGFPGAQGVLIARSGGNTVLGGPTSIGTYANDNTTGTTVFKLAKLTSTGLKIAATTDTNGVIGVVFGNAGTQTTNPTLVATGGQVQCSFDSAPSAVGNYVQISSSTAGACHDAGGSLPASGEIIGHVVSTVAVSGTYKILVQITER